MSMQFLYHCLIFLTSACIAVSVASRFKLGSVLGYLLAGVLIGPYSLNLISNSHEIMHFAEFGVVMMLFIIGLELEPQKLLSLRRLIFGLGSLQVFITSGVLMFVGMLLGFRWQLSLLFGMTFSLSSTAIVLQILQERSLLKTTVGQFSFATLLFQDIAVIPILLLMPILTGYAIKDPNNQLSNFPAILQISIVLVCIIAIILTSKYLSRYIFHSIAKTHLRELFTATSLIIVIGISLIMQAIGLSPALGAFIAGVVLANSEYKHTLESDIEPFKALLLGLFFISIGMSMDFSILKNYPLELFGITGIILLTKIIILFLLSRWFKLLAPHTLGYAIALSQCSEFAFVLLQYLFQLKAVSNFQLEFLSMCVALSMASTPILLKLYQHFIVNKFLSPLPDAYDKMVSTDNEIILAGYGRFGQVVGRFLSSQGFKITILENDSDQIELIRKYGNKVYYGDATDFELLKSAGIEHAKILIVAIDDVYGSVEITKIVKKAYPKLKVFARARNRRHAFELYNAGANYFKRETFDSSLSLAKNVMLDFGFDDAFVQAKVEQFAEFDKKKLFESFEFYSDEKELINFTKTAVLELDRILSEDNK